MVGWLRGLRGTLRELWTHPLTRDRRGRTLARWLAWQAGSRLVGAPVAVPFVGPARLLVSPGMTGATGNVYCGLHELEPMAFVGHLLRPGDLFVDAGANVGSYTVLASKACGARVLAFEPVPATARRLDDNVRLNDVDHLVEVRPVGLADRAGDLAFVADLDTMNRVVAAGEVHPGAVALPVARLDDELAGRPGPYVLKVDVEGFEEAVLAGAPALLADPALVALVIEVWDGEASPVLARLREAGLTAVRYDALTRALRPAAPGEAARGGNHLLVRSLEAARQRIASAPPLTVLGRAL